MDIWKSKHANCPQLIKEDGVFRVGNILSFGEFEKNLQDLVCLIRNT